MSNYDKTLSHEIASDAHIPEILAPAGDMSSALAALAAGADALYVGLKHFSARMQAENFGASELSRLVDVAHAKNARIYVAMNALLKPGDMDSAYRLAVRLARDVRPDAIIVQDLGMVDLARQAGFTGGLFFSTLANVTHPAALHAALAAGASRVILPRELSLDEIRSMGAACPDGLGLECFIHGALCYCVSGRCYWSSYMGGKSGLRGRCVQPCRRMYSQGGDSVPQPAPSPESQSEKHRAGRNSRSQRPQHIPSKRTGKRHTGRYFSCLDFSLDVLVKTLKDVPNLVSWKIEGRKKGPHYVYHVVTAYRMLRDNGSDPQARKMAEDILTMALGRPTSRARFLPQRENIPTAPDGQTSSGLLVGKVRMTPEGKPAIKTHIELLPQDYLRVGVEDQSWHCTLPVARRVPKAGTLTLPLPKHKTPVAGTPVYLIDRREPALMALIKEGERALAMFSARTGGPVSGPVSGSVSGHARLSVPVKPVKAKKRPDMTLWASIPQGRETRAAKGGGHMALWLSPKAQELSRTIVPRVCWWLPPVIWPAEENNLRRLVQHIVRDGGRHFVCNAPWQTVFFDGITDPALELWAGPFCNVANAAHIGALQSMGFAGAFVSPELPGADMLALARQSVLPLGAVLSGFWPVGIARFGLLGIKPDAPFASPKGEIFWARQYGQNVWLYPGWPLDVREKRAELETAGYCLFAHMRENTPIGLPEAHRPGLFNWDGDLL